MDADAGVVTITVLSRWLPDGSIVRADPVLYRVVFTGAHGPFSPRNE